MRAISAACIFLGIGLSQAADLVEIRSIDTSIKVELRYASERNIAGYPLYSKDFKALAERSTAKKLREAQLLFRRHGLGLKIWDAYRTVEAQAVLWDLHPNPDFVANPSQSGGSIHTWGAAVDATLVDYNTGKEVKMPTDFDTFGPEASFHYTGPDPEIRKNLRILQTIMARVGFQGIRTEWWHFVDKDWATFRPAKQLEPAAVTPTPAPAATPAPSPEIPSPAPVATPSPAVRTMRPPPDL